MAKAAKPVTATRAFREIPSPDQNLKIAATYIRVSTDEQTEYSPASQLKKVREWGETHGYIIPDEYVFVDEGISGKKVTGRDAFRQMIGVAKSKPKPFEAILLWKFSRFARNRDDAVFYKSILRKQLGIDVLSISEPIVEGKMGVIIEALIEAMDEYYSINLAEEVKRGMEEKHRRGELQSTPPYGYRVENNVLFPVEPEASFVRDMFQKYLGGMGMYAIARYMNDMGQHTHRGSPFENRTVEYILRNPVYVGKLRWNPTGRSRRNFNDPNIVIVQGKHTPLVDNDTFDAVQKKISEVKALHPYKGKPAEVQKDWLSGLVRCASCGATLVRQRPYDYWLCNNYSRGRCKTAQRIHEENLKAAILDRLHHDAASSAPLTAKIIHTENANQSEITTLTRAKAASEKMLDRLRDAYLSGADSIEEYKAGKASVSARIAQIDDQLRALSAKKNPENLSQNIKSAISAALETLENPDATTAQKYNAAHSIIEKAVLDTAANSLYLYYSLAL